MRNPTRPVRSAFALLACIAASASAVDIPYWGRFILDSTGEAAGPSKLKFDKNDKLKIAFRGHYDIQYVEYGGGGLKKEIADTGTGGEAKLDFDLDAQGDPHIAYFDAGYTKVYYAKRQGGKWAHAVLPKIHKENYNVDWYQLAMAVDPKGGAHISYAREVDNFPAQWHAYVDKDGALSDSGFVLPELSGKWNSMALDKDGKPVIAYFRHEAEDLMVSWMEGAAWKHQVVGQGTATPPHGFHCAIARQNDSAYRLIWQERTPLKHELWTALGKPGGAWETEKITDLPGYTVFASQNALAIGPDGRPYVAFGRHRSTDNVTVTDGDLMLAYREAGEWKQLVVDTVGITGLYAALAVDSKGMPAISYYEASKRTMKMALGSLTPVAVRRGMTIKRPASAKPGPRLDATGREDAVSGGAERPQGKVLFGRP